MAVLRKLRTEIDVIRSSAESMRIFTGQDTSFKLGEWIAWRDACIKAGETLDPKSFKQTT